MPVRVEIGPRDLAEGVVTLVRRDRRTKETVPAAGIAAAVTGLLEEIQAGLLAEATAFRDARTADVATLDEAIEAGRTGFARIPWDALGDEGEDRPRRARDHGALPAAPGRRRARRPRGPPRRAGRPGLLSGGGGRPGPRVARLDVLLDHAR